VKTVNEGHQSDTYRIDHLNEKFGNFPAVVPIESLREWFDDQDWEAGTYNRTRTPIHLRALSSTHRWRDPARQRR
jgi:hypothetical protein